MAVFIDSKGKKTYVKPEEYRKIVNLYYNKEGYTDAQKVISMIANNTKEYRRKKERELKFIEEYLNNLSVEEKKNISSFDYEGEEAKEKIYPLLDDFCCYYTGYTLAKRRPQHFTGERPQFYHPEFEDIDLSVTYGTMFYIAKTETIKVGFGKTNTFFSSVFEIRVNSITKIIGNMEYFFVAFKLAQEDKFEHYNILVFGEEPNTNTASISSLFSLNISRK